jgi:Trk K+ transport system NAD-binding subunit
VLLVSRGEESFIPRGDYVFLAGDHIILLSKNGSEQDIEKFFGAGAGGSNGGSANGKTSDDK